MKKTEETTREKIHESLMDIAVQRIERKGLNCFKIQTSDQDFAIITAEETKNPVLKLKFGDFMILNNNAYSGTYAIYLGHFPDPITLNNVLPQNWFWAQDETRPHYYGDGVINPEDLVKYGVRLVSEANPLWVRKFIRRMKYSKPGKKK
ncbi:MAG: hypothetical protein NTY31_02645 [Candidatus Falkowbacteria bacterium]|nr:hypothetical protein [Candidatus Falkowbacteria bacterium]